MTEPEKLFNETFIRWWRLHSVVYSFRDSLRKGLDASAEKVWRDLEGFYDRLIGDPYYRKLLINPDEFARTVDRRQFVERATAGLLKQTEVSLDAATLVFAHSVLDGAAFDFCRVTALHAPRDWELDLKDKQVPLAQIRGATYDQLLAQKLEEHLAQLERESLLVKIDRLFARCQPPKDWSPMQGYQFDRDKIRLFDDQRHGIIHAEMLGNPLKLFEMSDENLWYLFRTGMFFMGLVNLKYGLKLDPRYLVELSAPARAS